MSALDIKTRQKLAHDAKKLIIADLEQFVKVLIPPEKQTDPETRQFVTNKVNGLAERLQISFETLLEQTMK